MNSEEGAQKLHTDVVSRATQIRLNASDWSCCLGNLLQTISETLNVISMEFLRSFIRRRFAGKLVVASRNNGCSLRLLASMNVVVILTNTMPFSIFFIFYSFGWCPFGFVRHYNLRTSPESKNDNSYNK